MTEFQKQIVMQETRSGIITVENAEQELRENNLPHSPCDVIGFLTAEYAL